MKCYAEPHDTPPSVGAGDAEHLPRQDGTIRREPSGDAPTGWGCTDRMGMHRQVNRGEEGY